MRREDSRSGLGLEPAALRQRFARALAVRRAIYWADLLASATIGWAAFAASGWLHPWWLALTALLVATLALYRAVLFIHELAHLRTGAVPGLPLAWNLAVGLPLAVPSIVYVGTHPDHHRRTTYGTARDPEYEPIAHWRPLRIAASTLPMPLLPALIAVRWLVLGPLGWLALALVAGGVLAPHWVGHWYAVATAILVLNHLRTLAAHRHRHTGAPVDATAQVLDTVNVDGAPVVTALLAPVGLR
jgi:fatty acid desaturase